MKRYILLSVFFSTITFYSFGQVNIQWQTRYTSSGNNIDRAEDMVIDAAGNVYVTGIGQGTSGNFDFVTIKYDNNGNQQWIAQYNGPGNGLDEAHAITVASAIFYVFFRHRVMGTLKQKELFALF